MLTIYYDHIISATIITLSLLIMLPNTSFTYRFCGWVFLWSMFTPIIKPLVLDIALMNVSFSIVEIIYRTIQICRKEKT